MMGRRLTWLVVALIAIGLVGAGRVPQIPSGRRTQYLFLLDNGGYKYGYDTGLGSSEKALATHLNEVTGAYSYTGPSGPVTVEYTSGVGGFKPSKVAVPPALESGYARKAFGPNQFGSTGSVSNQYLPPVNVATYSQKFPSVSTHSSSYSGDYAATVPSANGEKSDGSYSFGYNVGDHSRHESSDASGNVVGSFSFVAKDDNALRTVNYKAGAESGFVATGSHLPSTGVSTPSVYNQVHTTLSPSSSFAHSSTGGASDGSYSFSYNAGDHSRQESADANGNVAGSFSFVPKNENALRTVNYKAGAESGFIATGSHLPSTGVTTSPAYTQVPTSFADSVVVNSANTYLGDNGASDGSYSFSYNAGDHNRQESSDANGNVAGSFSFVAQDDHALRTVNYKAGAESGFVATGSHLPSTGVTNSPAYTQVPTSFADSVVVNSANSYLGDNGASDGSYSFSYNAGDHNRQESSDANGNVAGSFSFVAKDDHALRTVNYKAGAESGFVATGSHLPSAGLNTHSVPTSFSDSVTVNSATSHPVVGGVSDGSYSFSYNAGDHSRQESADANGNVVGSFSFVPKDDSSLRTVNYQAGATSGFVASGAHLPSDSAGVSQSYQRVQPSPSSLSNANSQTVVAGHTHYDAEKQEKTDGSYSFSYNTGDHSRHETADSTGNVVGSFSFVAKDDGVPRKVDYVAGAELGFVARGGHLPKQPSESSSVSSQSFSQKQTPYSLSFKGYNHGSFQGGSTYTSKGYDTSAQAGTGDASYAFSYNTGDQSRQESSDPQGNVVGTFSYVDKDGLSKTVNYEAGAEKGFVAKGSHFPENLVPSAHFKTDHASSSPYGPNNAQSYLLGTNHFQPDHKSSVLEYSLGNLKVKNFLKPNAHRKVGYVFDS